MMFSVITKYHKGRHSLFLYNSEIFYAFTQDILRSLQLMILKSIPPHEKLDLAQVSYNYVDDKFNDKNEVDQMLDLVFPNQKEEQGDYEEPFNEEEYKALVAINKEVKQRQQSENTVDTLLDIASE
ncbi:hypothetical protein ACWM0J_10015 [Pediococcus acidilactici]